MGSLPLGAASPEVGQVLELVGVVVGQSRLNTFYISGIEVNEFSICSSILVKRNLITDLCP